MRVVAVLLVLSSALGCGGVIIISGAICFTTAINVSPQSVTIDHTALPPANSQIFVAFQSNVPSGCPFTQASLQNAVWSISTTADANISNSHDQNNINYGRATCINSASSPIMVTATVPSGNGATTVSATATLTCK